MQLALKVLLVLQAQTEWLALLALLVLPVQKVLQAQLVWLE